MKTQSSTFFIGNTVVGIIVYYLTVGLIFIRLLHNVYKAKCTVIDGGTERPIEWTSREE
jgi:hypothetical protein